MVDYVVLLFLVVVVLVVGCCVHFDVDFVVGCW